MYYYQQSNDTKQYILKQKITPNNRQSLSKFGGNNHHLAVSPNGEFVAIGTFDRESGLNEKVYIFGRFDNVWKQVAKINAPKDSLYFGSDVALSEDNFLITSWENTYFYQLACVDDIDVES